MNYWGSNAKKKAFAAQYRRAKCMQEEAGEEEDGRMIEGVESR